MDVEMPRMSGIEACRILRENAATHKTPIVLLTMRGEASAVNLGLDSGCTEYMLKPVNEEKLIAVFNKYLK
jgi:DNA-binding response OmpR family regulator